MFTIIYIDHFATISIVRQTKLISSNIDKMNLRFIRASQYIFQFNLIVKWKQKKINIVFDVLFRLFNKKNRNDRVLIENAKNVLNDIFAYNVTFVEIFKSYAKQLIDVYRKNKKCSKMLAMLKTRKKYDAKKKIYCQKSFFKSHVFDAKDLEKSKICNDNFEKMSITKKKRRQSTSKKVLSS